MKKGKKLYEGKAKIIYATSDKTYWNSSNLAPKDPVVSNLCSQIDIQNATAKAERREARKKKELAKNKKSEIKT